MTQISLVSKDKNIKKFTRDQMHIFWLPDEIPVDKDMQDVLVHMTESEKHGVITTLKLFSMYEMIAGNEYWSGRFRKIFPDDVDCLEMSSVFSMVEIAVHMQFYKKLNELLYLDNDEFYSSYVEDPILKERMEFIDSIVDSPSDLLSLAMFSIVEGAILYSSFAFLKHFQSKGKNRLMNVVRGINFSVKDEGLHSSAGAYCFLKLLKDSNLNKNDYDALTDTIKEGCEKVYEHECKIVDMIFEKGTIEGITATQMKHFVQSRINLCLRQLSIEEIYEVVYNPIAEDFYLGIGGLQYNDFFTSIGASYNRNWAESKFSWGEQQ